ncbi:MAG: hypothetical protein H6Q30_700, partial [Bacteroidetes bacterium]|nr:hypothetical protein [Bacteroidota bacterium]
MLKRCIGSVFHVGLDRVPDILSIPDLFAVGTDREKPLELVDGRLKVQYPFGDAQPR